ncbi:MAG: histidinol dehydrogenase [Chloroherpetonaceae bacterium]|nr:histidinol dehydrogenase [Chloroherpetonaceae bacterium]MDW8436548.1 histidinol dehydrogenase [Chloroherpetonaceae bacterium]
MFKIIDSQNDATFLREFVARRNAFDPSVEESVKAILADVKANGDEAVRRYAEKFDGAKLSDFRVSQKEINEAVRAADKRLTRVLEQAAANIERFHRCELDNGFFYDDGDGVLIGQKVAPIERALFYAPGGKAVYPSSVLMNAIPAKVAGVSETFLTSPSDREGKVHPNILLAAEIAGVKNVFRLGGAHAIAAFAFGTQSCPKVDKITGPGNQYVAVAKRLVFGEVSIDSVAGPSEIAIIADEEANPTFVALDLFSQAEHDEMASAILITPSRELADAVQREARRRIERMPRRVIIEAAIQRGSAMILTRDLQEACEIANKLAPEHLEIQTRNPFELLPKIRNAGAIFLGDYSSEPVGDYFAGPNHTLPTSGTARFFSPLSTRDFLKRTSIIAYAKERLLKTGDDIAYFADAENLPAHAAAIRARLEVQRGD